MISRIINFAKTIGSKIPIIRNFISTTREDEKKKNELIAKKISENEKKEFVLIRTPNNNKTIKHLERFLQSENNRVMRSNVSNFEEIFKINLNKISNLNSIEYKEKNLTQDLRNLQNNLIRNFKNKIISLNNEVFDNNNEQKYINLWTDFISENKRLILESEEQLVLQTAQIENSNDLDLMNALNISKQISKNLAINLINTLNEEINNIPIGAEINQGDVKIKLRDRIKQNFIGEFKNIFLISKFGLHSNILIKKIFETVKVDKKLTGQELFENLLIVNKLQESIHGCILQDRNKLESSETELAMINPEITKNVFEKIAELNFDFAELRNKFLKKEDYDKKKNNILGEINNLKQFIYNCALNENSIQNEAFNQKDDYLLQSLEINPKTYFQEINKLYQKITWISKYMGEMHKEEIEGSEFKSISLINLFNNNTEEKVDHLKRLLLETSLLAGIEVMLREKGVLKETNFLTRVQNSKGKPLPAILNFQSIPWLKNFYQERVRYYTDLCQKENSLFKIGSIVKQISKIGKELHRSKLFSSSDFFERYGLEKESIELNNLMGEMTDVGRMSLNIDYVSNFLASIDPEENEDANKDLLSNIEALISLLRKECIIYDQQGKEIYAPIQTNINVKNTYEKLARIVGDEAFLSLNTPLVVNFLRQSFGKDKPDNEPIQKDSYLAKNQVLATWLYYILVKFLPEHSNSVDSLKARVDIFDQLIDQNFQNKARFTSELYRKVMRKARGLNEQNQPSYKGKGVIKALCLDLERHLNWHIEGNQKSKIDIEFLLNKYLHVENQFRNNPKAVGKIQKIQKEVFKNDEPIIKPLENSLIRLFEQNPMAIVKFVKANEKENPQLKNKLALDLLIKIDKQINSLQKNSKHIEILDSDEHKIREMIRILENLSCLGFILNTLNQNSLVINKNLFKFKKGEEIIVNRAIKTIEDFLQLEILLKEDDKFNPEEERFSNQFELKNKLRALVSKNSYGFKPKYGTTFNWQRDLKEFKDSNTKRKTQILV